MKKTINCYGTLYASIAMNVKTNDYYGTVYVGIAMNVKNLHLLWDLICKYCIECKKPTFIMGFYKQILH